MQPIYHAINQDFRGINKEITSGKWLELYNEKKITMTKQFQGF